MKTAYVKRSDIYNLFDVCGIARIHVGDIDILPTVEINDISESMIERAKQCLIDNGIDRENAESILIELDDILTGGNIYKNVK